MKEKWTGKVQFLVETVKWLLYKEPNLDSKPEAYKNNLNAVYVQYPKCTTEIFLVTLGFA